MYCVLQMVIYIVSMSSSAKFYTYDYFFHFSFLKTTHWGGKFGNMLFENVLFKLRAGMVLKQIQHGPYIIQTWYQIVPPHPHPWRQQKSPVRGQKQSKKQVIYIFHPFY